MTKSRVILALSLHAGVEMTISAQHINIYTLSITPLNPSYPWDHPDILQKKRGRSRVVEKR
ncbi:hypothetical protein BGZ61DRAFT_459185 [Ilyonectria robusta]|uniref:uncharacterized protein n=1 Tax=Ilyonectria robusta TaxID=1079257 RepID=UPI001E8D3CBA|nr:uncharacterized protein BGZ61DRAFT_459185 [Ilyonectria robusta]KAH8672353.1 hypothetical protein BGZ61DRAFT_459185 [Ilyonectria robusta]